MSWLRSLLAAISLPAADAAAAARLAAGTTAAKPAPVKTEIVQDAADNTLTVTLPGKK
jgi:hypothetical protein